MTDFNILQDQILNMMVAGRDTVNLLLFHPVHHN